MTIDPTEVATQTAKALITEVVSRIYSPIEKIINVNRAKFLESFTNYCEYMMLKSSMVRTLYSKNQPIKLDDVYVKTAFYTPESKNLKFRNSDTDIINRFASGNRLIIRGNGGSGKTIFLKKLWLERFKRSEGKIPVFIELRRLNDLQKLDLMTFCRSELQSSVLSDQEVFENLCKSGKFEFIFDGFDEVAREKRKIVERQILDMSEKFRKCCILVSGREDDRFSSWGNFEVFSVAPLTHDELKLLLSKVPFNPKVKRKFLDALNQDFFEKHKSFLSSPLLAIMMLMTFSENAIIPNKITTFYNNAFQTLLTWHDATKDTFERQRSCTVDQFRKLFATFCLISYHEQAFEFDEAQLRSYIDKSIKYHSLEVKVDDVISDLCESANLIQKDGLKYIFIHRSFQEYFAAECVMQVVSGKAKVFLSEFSKRANDSVFFMCHEIHPELVYDSFLEGCIAETLKSELFQKLDSPKARRSHLIFTELHSRITFETVQRRFSLYFEKYEPSKDALHAIMLCNNLRDLGFLPDLGFHIFRAAHKALNHLSDDFLRVVSKDIELDLKVTLHEDGIKIHLRNSGARKITLRELNHLKSKILNTMKRNLQVAEKEIFRELRETNSFMEQLKSDRMAKSQSIDDILGI